MVIVMKAGAEQGHIDAVIAQIRELNYTPHPIQGTERAVHRSDWGRTRQA